MMISGQLPVSIPELIKRRRSQMLIHSYMYYEKDNPVISDDQWQVWADELEKLQKTYPEHCKLDWYDNVFADWDGATGCHLPRDEWIRKKALQLYRYKDATRTNTT